MFTISPVWRTIWKIRDPLHVENITFCSRRISSSSLKLALSLSGLLFSRIHLWPRPIVKDVLSCTQRCQQDIWIFYCCNKIIHVYIIKGDGYLSECYTIIGDCMKKYGMIADHPGSWMRYFCIHLSPIIGVWPTQPFGPRPPWGEKQYAKRNSQ